MVRSVVLLLSLACVATCFALPASPPGDPLHRALTDPNFVPPKDDFAIASHDGPLAMGLLAPLTFGGVPKKLTKRSHCPKCGGGGGYGGGGYGGGGYGGGGGGGGYGNKGGGGGGCRGGCGGGGGYPGGGGYGNKGGGGGGYSYSQSQSSSSAGSGGYWGKK